MALQLPPEVAAVLNTFDAREDIFEVMELQGELEKAVTDPNSLSHDAKRGWWAECAAFAFDTHEAPDGGPWKTYFQPMMTFGQGETIRCTPDLRQADADIITYWGERAKAVKHPVLAARYADLVWDTTKFVTKGKPPIECARLAIDCYVASLKRDDGEAWGDNFHNLGRALHLALSIRDEKRTAEVVHATLDYSERTAEDSKPGTYCYLFDNLLPPDKGPELSEDQERRIVEMFEAKFAEMTTPGGLWDGDPHRPRDVGLRLAAYYQRKGKLEESVRVYRAIANAFERRAKMGDALSAIFFYQEARKFFLKAGLSEEADRIQAESQRTGPAAEKQMVPMRVEHEIPTEQLNKFLDGMMDGGLDKALLRLTLNFIPDQAEIARHVEEVAEDYPLYAIFFGAAKKMGHGHIEADVGDETGDPDGKMVHHTAQRVQFDTPWISWLIERMIQAGLSASKLADFVRLCGLFTDDRAPLIRQGLEAYFMGDYARSIHLLIPQIERAIVNLAPLAGKPSNKAHRTGRGVMLFKSLNDVLEKGEWPIPEDVGENLRMYLLAALSHPKGLNIRNNVCHGLWPAARFTKAMSERVLHVLLAVSMLRTAKEDEPRGANAEPESAGSDGN